MSIMGPIKTYTKVSTARARDFRFSFMNKLNIFQPKKKKKKKTCLNLEPEVQN